LAHESLQFTADLESEKAGTRDERSITHRWIKKIESDFLLLKEF
jgi:hypothetical protein